MLEDRQYLFEMTSEDRRVFDWKAFDSLLAKYYSSDRGRVGLTARKSQAPNEPSSSQSPIN